MPDELIIVAKMKRYFYTNFTNLHEFELVIIRKIRV